MRGLRAVSLVFAVMLGALLLTSTAAFAAAPEMPQLEMVSQTGGSVSLRGVLNPGAAGEAGTYRFLYAASSTGECENGGETTRGIALGLQGEEVLETISGLGVSKQYAVCLLAENDTAEKTLSGPVSFTTGPETPVTKSPAVAVTTTSAVLEGTLDPHSTENVGWYFDYSTEATCGENPGSTNREAEVSDQAHAVHAEATGLTPHQKYEFCLVATNGAGSQTLGNQVSFETGSLPPAILGQSATEVKGGEATLGAQLNPENESTSYAFEYATTAAALGTVAATKAAGSAPLTGYGEQSVSAALSGLSQHTTYYYRVVAENEQSQAEGKPAAGEVEQFITGPLQTPRALPAGEVATTGATLDGMLNPLHAVNSASYEFRYRHSAGECEGEGEQATPVTPVAGAQDEAESAAVSGLEPNTKYAYCLRETDEAGEEALSAPSEFRTPPEAYATEASSSGVVLHAVLDPEGSPTTYSFQYGPTAGYGSQTAEETVQSQGSVRVEASLQGLSAASTYHYRVLATNAAHETFASEDHTLTTQTTGGELELPDGRQWELVSPPNKHGADLRPISFGLAGGGLIEAAQDGEAITYVANAPTETEPKRSLSYLDTQILSKRGPDGWVSHDINTSGKTAVYIAGTGERAEYLAFSPDLSKAVVEPPGFPATPLSPLTSEQIPYLRNNDACETTSDCYTPLVTPADTPPGTKTNSESGGSEGKVEFAQGETPDLSHIILWSSVPLTATAAKGSTGGLYEWSEGGLQPVSVLPEDEGGGEVGASPEEVSVGVNTYLGYRFAGSSDSRHAVSSDGSRIFWGYYNVGYTSAYKGHKSPENGDLYMRDTKLDETILIAGGGARFEIANAAGTRVFFSTSEAFSEAKFGGRGALEVCEIVEAAGKASCKDTELAPEVQGLVSASEDGSYVYFVSNAALAPGAVDGECDSYEAIDQSGKCNLYEEHDGSSGWEAPQLVAVLSDDDMPDWGGFHSANESTEELVSRASPDGRWFAFMSTRSLTGYDNLDAVDGQPDEEVYLYHASPSGAGSLVCASCDPTGTRPVGETPNGSQLHQLVDPAWRGQAALAADLPTWPEVDYSSKPFGGSYYEPRNLSDSGRLFFNSDDALVPQDVDGTWDVYEYEPEGVGSCSDSSLTFNGRSNGCVGLISAGSSPEESGFLDASEDGDDVFFLTASQLVPQDVDSSLDVYDAHACSAASPCVSAPASPPPCTSGDACKAPPAPQPSIYGAPASATFSGNGDVTAAQPVSAKPTTKASTRAQMLARALKACRKKPKRKRKTCERDTRSKDSTRGKPATHGTKRKVGR